MFPGEEPELWRDVAQGHHGGVREDVNASELPGSRARSAVFLVHAESPRQAPGGKMQNRTAGRPALRKRMLSHGECERLVTRITGSGSKNSLTGLGCGRACWAAKGVGA
jgi:hypothetical protein